MKLQMKDPKYHHGLMPFIAKCVPDPLIGIYETSGYGYWCEVRLPGEKHRSWCDKLFDTDRRELVAKVFDDRVILYHPQYFSDFQSLITEYEENTGKEVTLECWQSGSNKEG